MTTVSKKKVLFALSALFILFTLSVVVPFALQPPTLNTSSYLDIGVPTETDAENLLSLCEIQSYCGSFNSLRPVCLYKGSTSNTLILVLASSSDIGYSCSLSGSSWSVSTITKFRMVLTSQGFSFQSTWQNISIPDSNMVFYSPSFGSPLTLNPNFNFGTQYPSDTLSDIVVSWGEYYQKLVNYDSDLRDQYNDGFNDGLADGYETGYSDGFDLGFSQGYQSGNSDGFNRGFSAGQEEGESIGYEVGFSDGYETGFQDGLIEDPSYNVVCTYYQQTLDDLGSRLELFYDPQASPPFNLIFWKLFDQSSLPPGNYSIYQYTISLKESEINNIDNYRVPLPDLITETFPDLQVESVTITRYGDGSIDAKVRLSRNESYGDIFSEGYQQGYQGGIKDVNALTDGIGSVAKAPIESLKNALDFEIFGLNIGGVLLGFIALLFIMFIWSKIKKLIPI